MMNMNWLHNRTLRTLTCCVFASLALTAQIPVQASPPASWAPIDIDVYVEITNFDQFLTQWKKTLFHRFSKDEQLGNFAAQWSIMLDQHLTEIANKLGLESIDQLKIEPRGGAALIVRLANPAAPGGKPHVSIAIVADWADNSPQLQEVLDKESSKIIEQGGKKSSKDFNGVTVTTYTLAKPAPKPAATMPDDLPNNASNAEDNGTNALNPDNAAPSAETRTDSNEFGKTISFATVGTVTVIGSDQRLVSEIASRVKNPDTDSLAGSKLYQALKHHCSPLGQLNMIVNMPRITSLAKENDADAREIIEAAGVKNLGAFVATVAIAPKDKVALEARGFLPLPGEKTGITKMVMDNLVNQPLLSANGLPADTVLGAWYNYKFETLIDSIYEVRKRIDPENAEQFKAELKLPISETESIDLEKLFKSLAMPLTIQLALSPPFSAKDVSILISLNHTDRQAIAQLFSFPLFNQFCQKREVMGQSVYDVMFPPVGASIAITDNVFAVGNTPGIDQLVNSETGQQEQALSADPQYQFAAGLAPQKVCYALYVDTHKFLSAALALYTQAKKAAEAGEEEQFNFSYDMTSRLLDFMKGIPFDTLSDPQAVLQYAPAVLTTTTKTPEGLLLYTNVTEPIKR